MAESVEHDAVKQTADILANAAAEAATPGADTDSGRECPFCVMMRKGGCEVAFKAFMECGEKADKGEHDMADCLPQFDVLNKCMESNKAVFDVLLQEMKDEEAAGSSSKEQHGGADANDAAAAAAQPGPSVHQQEQQQQQQQQDPPSSSEGASAAAAAAAAAPSGSSSGSSDSLPSSPAGVTPLPATM